MQTSTKKMKRIERKKKKLAALIEITELNNKDRNELQSLHLYGPSGDSPDTMDVMHPNSADKKKKVDSLSCSCESITDDEKANSETNTDGCLCIGKTNSKTIDEGTCLLNHKTKKKRKLKHPEVNIKLRKGKAKLNTEEVEREEWPLLNSPRSKSGSQKRKSSNDEVDPQKDRPVKIVKRQNEYFPPLPESGRSNKDFDFADELASFKRDVELKKTKEKKLKKEAKSRVTSSNESAVVDGELTLANSEEENPPDISKEIAELETLLKKRKKQLKEIPVVRLKGVGKEANLEVVQRTPILPGDVQNLLVLSQLGHDCPRFPRWLELKKFNRLSKTVVIVVEGASAYDFYSAESRCPVLSGMDVKAEMVSPYCYNASICEELCAVPITRQQKKELEKRFGKEICPEALLTDRIIKVLRSAFSISSVLKTRSEDVEQKISVPSTDKFPRTELLLSIWQLIEEGYPLPYGSSDMGNRYPDYVMTKEEYKEVTPSSPMWGLDCEMCLTRMGNELTRVSVVDEQHKTVYESLCVPPNPIINYLTEYSGITPQMLKGVTTRLEDIQQDLQQLFPPDVILVGQSLSGDLHALKMMHPYIIDTSVIFNLTGNRRHKTKLAKLSMEFLNEAIQQRGASGHDSVEDSLAALKLVQLKLSKNIAFGDAVLSGLKEEGNSPDVNTSNVVNSSYPEHSAEDFQDLQIEVGPTMATSLFKHITMRKKRVAVIGQEETLAEYSAFVAAAHRESKQLVKTHTTASNTETINVTCRECKNSNFTLAHLVLSEEEDITQVDSWMGKILNAPPFNSMFIVTLAGSHNSFANGACLVKVKRPNLKLKPPKTN